MASNHRYSERSRELARDLGNRVQLNRDRTKQANALGFTVDEVFELGLILAQMGMTPEEMVKSARIAAIANLKGLDEQKLIRLNVKE